MNQVFLLGRIASDPYINGTLTKLTMATKVGYDKEKQQDKVAFVPVSIFGLSESQKTLLEKGKQVLMHGIVRQSKYEKEGETVYVTDVVVGKGGISFL